METEARMSREAWGRSMDASDLARAEVMSLRTIVHAQMTEITEFTVETDHTTERYDSTSGTGHHTAGAGDSLTGIGDSITRTCYCITGTAGTRWKMAPKRATRSTPVTTTPAPTATTTTTVTNAQLQAMIDQGVSATLAVHDATRNGIDSHTSGTGVRGSERVARECTY
ncbi:hypothetical protein Tco_1554288 [Tanacetum coccineum]